MCNSTSTGLLSFPNFGVPMSLHKSASRNSQPKSGLPVPVTTRSPPLTTARLRQYTGRFWGHNKSRQHGLDANRLTEQGHSHLIFFVASGWLSGWLTNAETLKPLIQCRLQAVWFVSSMPSWINLRTLIRRLFARRINVFFLQSEIIDLALSAWFQ